MLVLTRKENEAIIIGGVVRIVIVEVRHGQRVRIGVEAPKEIPVHREEVQKIIDEEIPPTPPRKAE